MNSLIALEELIKAEEARVKFERKQLADHESGENKLSRVALASAETKLDEAQELLTKHKLMLEELLKQDQEELAEKERLEEAIRRKKYFEEQNMRILNSKERSDDQKLEAMMIIDELPENINFEDKELFEVAVKSLELNLKDHKELADKLGIIKAEFKDLLKNTKDGKISELEMLNYKIPVLILHFSVFLSVLKENFTVKCEDGKTPPKCNFHGFPKYEDWWIAELWSSHQAYFALFRWKSIINTFCRTGEQKRSWAKIFDNWIFIKKVINDKGAMAFDYHFAMDSLLIEYAELEEELNNKNLESMETIVKRITSKEDFSKVMKNHNIITPYLQYKKERIEGKKEEN
ncbi:hypothetical protein [Poseidonibacter lekithochrous]|uniref:hypothetical protein n=1 Tax=Poseidonibacter lekithochrous TaxID=1904463 RepID=UPI0008FC8974|nr:hypothetical protein [Poseidonibacter lekithochrous]QKJ22797.1 hypothetical protein ALEK_1526 [Poseidonibacter lekithochrous]